MDKSMINTHIGHLYQGIDLLRTNVRHTEQISKKIVEKLQKPSLTKYVRHRLHHLPANGPLSFKSAHTIKPTGWRTQRKEGIKLKLGYSSYRCRSLISILQVVVVVDDVTATVENLIHNYPKSIRGRQ